MRSTRSLAQSTFVILVALAEGPAWADNICGETVASNRTIDGIPAYAQCDAASSGPIYSNNGVDTAISSGGAGWVRTQMSGGYQCTELAHRYLYFRWNVKNVPNGNAGTWCDATPPAGLVKASTPVHGDLIVFAPGSCGADTTTGHVAVVDVVNSNNTVTFIEQNRPNRRSCAINTAACFLHASANDGRDGGVSDGAMADAAPVTVPDARPPRDLGSDRSRPDVAGAAGSGGTSAAGGTTGTGGSGGVVASGGPSGGSSVGGITNLGGSPQAGSSTSPAAGSTAVSTTATSEANQDAAAPSVNEKESGGCSCALADSRHGPPLPVLLLGLLWWRARRRSH